MASSGPLLSGTIEADDETPTSKFPKGSIGDNGTPQREPVVLVPGATANGSARAGGSAEEGGIVRVSLMSLTELTLCEKVGILKQSSHPVSLATLYLFRSAAIVVYVLCGKCEW